MGKHISGKTHSKEQLDHWANQNNPNNKAYKDRMNNYSNQTASDRKIQQYVRCGRSKRYKQLWPDWAPDYIEYYD